MEKVETRSKRRSSEPSGGGVRGLDVRGARGLCRWKPGGETSRSGDTHTNATRRECDDDTLGRCDDEFPQNFRGSRTLTLRSGLRFKSPRLTGDPLLPLSFTRREMARARGTSSADMTDKAVGSFEFWRQQLTV